LSYARLKATDFVVIEKYYDLLKITLEEYDLFDASSRIFNCDETGLCYQHTPLSVVAMKGQHHPRAVTTGNRRQVTVLACANAAGYHLPPLVILKRKTLPMSILNDEVPGTMYSLSDSGWMDSETFDNWFSNHFLVHAPPARPLLLLLDGHSTHYNPQFIAKAAHEQVIVFCLPPNTTHLLQPLDKGLFGPLKTYWNEECHQYLRSHPGQVMNDYSFNTVFGRAWGRAMTIPNAAAAFRTTGVYPFDRTAVKTVDTVQSLSQLTGLHYIPVLSPAPSRRKSTTPSHSRANTDVQVPHDVPHSNLQPSNLLLNEIPRTQSVISRFYPDCQPEIRPPKSYEKTSAKILTGAEYRKEQAEKDRLKKEKQQLASEKRKRKEAKKAAKASSTKKPPTKSAAKGKLLDVSMQCISTVSLHVGSFKSTSVSPDCESGEAVGGLAICSVHL